MVTSSISFSGLASGLDTSKIIEAILRVDQLRIDALRDRQAALTTQISGIGTLRSRLSVLQTKLDALRFQSQVMAQSATADRPEALSATADSSATAGTFKVWIDALATATRRDGVAGIGDEFIDETAPLAESGLSLTPTGGRFTINGIAIQVDSPTSVDDFVTAINAASADTGVIASYATDGSGRPTHIRIENDPSHPDYVANKTVALGSAADTSNFLTAVKLSTAVQVGDRMESTSTLGRIRTGVTLDSARISGAFNASGTFTINGIDFAYDATTTLSSLMSTINGSAANVSMSYDPVANRMSLASKATGAQSIAVSDPDGLLGALGVTDASGAVETLGANASFRIDTVAGGAAQSSTSNTVTGIVPGVTLNLLQEGAAAVTVTIGRDTDRVAAAMAEFVTAFNDVVDYVRSNTRPDAQGQPGLFQGRFGVRLIGDTLRSIAGDRVTGLTGSYSSLSELGISSGAVGSTPGTTNGLVFDEAKFKERFEANPQAAFDVLNSSNAGSEGLFSRMRTFVNNATLPNGLLPSIADSVTATQSDFDGRIQQAERRLETRRARLEAQFARMESAVAALQAQGQRLNAQFAGLSNSFGG